MKLRRILASFVPILVVGCAAPRPDGLVKDATEPYVDEMEDGEAGNRGKAKVAVFTSTYAEKEDQALAALLDAKIAELLTSSTSFEIAERTTLEALKFEDVFAGTDTGATVPTKSDYILLAKILSGHRIDTSVDFRFYDVKARKTVLSKNIPAGGRGDALDRSLSQFAQSFADAFEKKVRVIQTRGNGMVARISRGLASGVKPGIEVEFYEFDDAVKDADGMRVRDTVGRGGVLECSKDSAWVEVDDYYLPSVNVRQGDYVEIIADPSQRRSRNVFTRFMARFKALFN